MPYITTKCATCLLHCDFINTYYELMIWKVFYRSNSGFKDESTIR